jgi:hypothetical protein
VVAPVVARAVDGAAGVEGSVVPGVVGVGDALALPEVFDVVEVPGAVVLGTMGVAAPAGFIVVPGLAVVVEPIAPELEPGTHGVVALGVAPNPPPGAWVAELPGKAVPGEVGVAVVLGSVVPVVVPAFGVVVPLGV